MNRKQRSGKTIQPSLHGGFELAHRRWQAHSPQRRDFLTILSLLPASLALPALAAGKVPKPDRIRLPKKDPWLTLAVVQQHLLPSEEKAPGAKEIQATAYLQKLFADQGIDPEEKNFILNGPGWLNDLAMQQHKTTFVVLTEAQQEDLLQQIAKTTAGEDWLSILLGYIFEALLSAPIYGGNPGGIGWKWLQHDPGFPLPQTARITWQALQKRR